MFSYQAICLLVTQVIRIFLWPMSQYLCTQKYLHLTTKYVAVSLTLKEYDHCVFRYIFEIKINNFLIYYLKMAVWTIVYRLWFHLPRFPSNENQCGWYRRKGSDRRRLCQLELSLSTTHRLGSPPLFRPRLLVAIYWSPRPPSSAAIMIKGARAAPDFLSL